MPSQKANPQHLAQFLALSKNFISICWIELNLLYIFKGLDGQRGVEQLVAQSNPFMTLPDPSHRIRPEQALLPNMEVLISAVAMPAKPLPLSCDDLSKSLHLSWPLLPQMVKMSPTLKVYGLY